MSTSNDLLEKELKMSLSPTSWHKNI